MHFRRPDKSDLALLARWNHRLIQDEGHRNRMDIPQLRRRMARWLKKEYQALLFEADQIPLGYVLYRKEKNEIYLRQFFIDRPYRRKGFGRKAMRLLFKRVWPKKKRIVLEVLVHNRRAIDFWKSVGFKDYSLTLEKGPFPFRAM
jgi:ribosomal protein S18 acetylase RimI-like enzyme